MILRSISHDKAIKISELISKKAALKNRFESLRLQKRELKRSIDDKERQLATLRNRQEGIRTVSSKDLDIEDVDQNEKVSRYLIQEGKISLEQNEKVLQKMEIMQMDYLGSCIALGFIDIETAKKAIKINKVATKSDGLV